VVRQAWLTRVTNALFGPRRRATRILLVHNYYRSGAPGGEDIVFHQERDLLRDAGYEVFSYTRSNDEMSEHRLADRARVVVGMARSRRTLRELGQLIRSVRPHVAHFHNVFPLISSSGYEACLDAGVPVVQTVHNFRMVCSSATHFRAGAACESCTPGNPWPAVRHACYRGSHLASLAVAAMLQHNHRLGVYRDQISRFIALTEFSARRLVSMGISSHRVTIKPNFVDLPTARLSPSERGPKFIFVGRLAEEKGARFILESWKRLKDIPLLMIGDGPLRADLESYARHHNLPVEFLGFQGRKVIFELVRSARAVVVPSLCFEGGVPLTLLEAMACGSPVVATKLGGIPEFVTQNVNGLLCDPGDAEQLAMLVRRLAGDDLLCDTLAERAVQLVRRVHGREANLTLLTNIYDAVFSAVGAVS
jgi:glycosyltransferase involved in cell wall biosynthesis